MMKAKEPIITMVEMVRCITDCFFATSSGASGTAFGAEAITRIRVRGVGASNRGDAGLEGIAVTTGAAVSAGG